MAVSREEIEMAIGFTQRFDFSPIIGWELYQVTIDKYHMMFWFENERLAECSGSLLIQVLRRRGRFFFTRSMAAINL
jgi:hypothetical protein